MKKKIIKILSMTAVLGLSGNVIASEYVNNDLRDMFTSNEAIIYEISIRTFNANDRNGNGIIEVEKGEQRGNFLNAVKRLDELKEYGINAIHVMPINPIGVKSAIGTAGSVYAMKKIDGIDENITDRDSNLTAEEQLKYFIDECHKRDIRVFVDIPACASYDMTLTNPDLFVKDGEGKAVTPADWSDVRLFATKNTDGTLNRQLIKLHKKYVDMLIEAGADGIRADVATMKPAKFWEEIIKYARKKDGQFMFLAEASEAWGEAVSPYAVFTDYKKLTKAGFDGYYGSCFEYLNFKDSKDIKNLFKYTEKTLKRNDKKAIIGGFATHDVKSPYLTSDNYAETIMYLNATLPLNPYYTDGFPTGDKYIYPYSGKRTDITYTDNPVYYTHKGQIDIFNYSRKPGGNNKAIEKTFKETIRLRKTWGNLVTKGEMNLLKTSDKKVYAYERRYKNEVLVVITNADFKNKKEAIVKLKKGTPIEYEEITKSGKIERNGNLISIEMEPGKTAVLHYKKDRT